MVDERMPATALGKVLPEWVRLDNQTAHLRRPIGMVKVALLVSAGVLTLGACTGDADGLGSSPSLEQSRSETLSALPSTDMASRFSVADDCPVMAPNELPNGRPPGSRRPFPVARAKSFLHVWGHGLNRVIIGRGQEVVDEYGRHDRTFPRTGEPVTGRDGIRRWVIAIGDPPLGQIAYKYLADTCPYVIWTQSGLTWQDALAYAARLGTPSADDGAGGTRIALETHCGVVSVTINGRLWLADPPLGDHNPPPGWDENLTLGYWVEIGPGRAEFHGDEGQRASFRRAVVGAEDPDAGCE